MVLLDAVYINNSGGKILLNYLVEILYKSKKEVFYLLDLRVKGDYEFLQEDKVQYLESSLLKRHSFYRANQNRFSTVLCFGNIPPTFKLKVNVYTYFHNSIYFFTTKEFSIKERLLISAKSWLIRLFKNNTDKWWVQTEQMSFQFAKYWNIGSGKIDVLPFYSSIDNRETIVTNREKYSFLYISDGHPNKMHLQLLEAFKELFKVCPQSKLYLTISPQYPALLDKINTMQTEGLSVENLGWCSREVLRKLYQKLGFFIFPSNQESFGLGLIEAAQYGMKILASDLPYVHAVIKPSLTFNPNDKSSIINAMIVAINNDLPIAKLSVANQIDQILEKLN
ncbi:glycosyltransferase [Algoriphagus sp.]|uniref:glycosyltransferase n=1 Tax=Algoriphagus sp. TaxID=1872435 RepID=UPI00391CAACE